MNETGIEWTNYSSTPLRYRDADGNVVWACVHASPGCQHCYAETLAARYGRGQKFNVPNMNGLTPFLDEKEMHRLLTSKKLTGKKVFLNDMTDTFGEWVPDELIVRLFAAMAFRLDVTFQVLTKRAERMRAFLTALYDCSFDAGWSAPKGPLPNVWCGVSVENDDWKHRLDELRRTPAAVRYVSVEPLLGRVNLSPFLDSERCNTIGPEPERFRCGNYKWHEGFHTVLTPTGAPWFKGDGLDWIIVGGESGPGSRPCKVEWIRSIVTQCTAAGVPCFVKQLGSYPVEEVPVERLHLYDTGTRPRRLRLKDRKGGNIDEWPPDLRVREFPEVTR